MNFTDDQLSALKDRNPVDSVAGQWVTLRSKGARRAGQYVGPCPICSDDPQSKTAGRFECDADKWVCAVCSDGGDVIKLVRLREGLDFVAAVERLGGARAEVITPAIADRRGAAAYKRADVSRTDQPATYPDDLDDALKASYAAGWQREHRRVVASEHYRKIERDRLFGFWTFADGSDLSPVERYLAGRRLIMPRHARLRCHPAMPYFADGREREPRRLHIGPAMLAPIHAVGAEFIGLHVTWLDPAGPKGKAHIIDPDTGEIMPAKKCRGTKAGGYIDLGGDPDRTPLRMFAGEGIETVLAVYTALARSRRLRAGDVFRSGIDLGNLAGRAIETVPHPTLKTAAGRVMRVPGPDADMTSPAMPVPETVEELVFLGDGDSDPILTRNALDRARQRSARPGRAIRNIFAPVGRDFNDLLT